MNDLISVVLPVYNVEKYIRQALDSVINQTYQNLEIILVDDGSPDNSGSICDEYASKDNRIRVIHKENGGVSSARNAGIDMATGDWLYFMDPDDWIELNTFELVMGKIAETKADMCFFDFYRLSKNKKRYCYSIRNVDGKFFFNDMSNINTLLAYDGGSVCCSFFRSSVINKSIRFDETIKIGEDYLFRLECYGHISSFAYISKALYYYRDNANSAMNSSNCEFQKYADLMYDKFYNLAPKHKYPDFVHIVANSNCITNLNRVILGAFSSAHSKKERKKIIFEYIGSANYQKSLKKYDARLLSGMAKIIVNFKKPTLFKIHCVYILRKIKKFLDRIKYISHN